MHVMHVIDHLGAGGAQRLLADLAPRQVQRGYRVTVVCLRRPTPLSNALKAAGVQVRCLELKRTDIRQLTVLTALLHADQPDIVHTHLTLSCLLGRVAAVIANIPRLIVHDHEADAEVFITPGPLLVLKRFVEPRMPPQRLRYIVISHTALLYAREIRHLPPDQIALVPNGIDIARLEERRFSVSTARTYLGLPDRHPLIGLAGRLAPEKGVDLLLEALVHLPHVHAAIAGHGPLFEDLHRLASKLGITQRTHFLGYLDDIRPLLWGCDLYVQPSRREAFGLAAAEAAATGLPVVATNIGGLRDIVLDGVTGRLVQPNNIVELARTLKALLEDTAYARSLGCAGRDHVRQHFAIDTVLDRLDSIYREAFQ